MFSPQLDHVAFLVTSVEETGAVLSRLGLSVHPIQHFEEEGTLECYVGETPQTGRLLLMEAIADGSYMRRLLKRGPGLHHIAVNVPDLVPYVTSLEATGWTLHPSSETVAPVGSCFLMKRGLPILIEVFERAAPRTEIGLISKVELPFFTEHRALLKALQLPELRASADEKVWLTCGAMHFALV